MTSSDLASVLKQSLKSLKAQRDAIESEAEAITSELTTPPAQGVAPMGIDTPLVDQEGYPRNDIDVYRARTLRGRLAVLRTDHKAIVKEMDTKLGQLALAQNPDKLKEQQEEQAARSQKKPKPKFNPKTGKWVVQNWDGTIAGAPNGESRSFSDVGKADSDQVTQSMQQMSTQETTWAPIPPPSLPTTPFARVNEVFPSSPSFTAGLQEGDLITRFGTIEANPDAMQQVGALVPAVAGENGTIDLVVLRGTSREALQLLLKPQPWGGRGLLGCHIVPH